jgi:hypothetical protein
VMKRTKRKLLEITSLEEKMKQKDREGEMKEKKSKEEVKLHHLNIPYWDNDIAKEKSYSEETFNKEETPANMPQVEATLADDDISLVHELWRMPLKTCCRDMKRIRWIYMEGLRGS